MIRRNQGRNKNFLADNSSGPDNLCTKFDNLMADKIVPLFKEKILEVQNTGIFHPAFYATFVASVLKERALMTVASGPISLCFVNAKVYSYSVG